MAIATRARQHGGVGETTGLLERLQWVINNRAPTGPHGRRSARALSVRAGLSGSHLGVMQTRLKRDPSSGADYETLRAIATAASVRVEWLADGEDPRDVVSAEPHPARALAARLCREAGIYDGAITSVLQETVTEAERQRPTIWWIDRIRFVEREILAGLRGPKPEDVPATQRRPVSSRSRK